MTTAVLVVAGAMIGGPLRYLADRAVQSLHDSVFPWGTLAVNVAGSFVLGALVAGGVPADVMTFAGVGLCGALTTYSTFGYETLRLVEDGAHVLAWLNAAASLVLGIGAAVGGGALIFALLN